MSAAGPTRTLRTGIALDVHAEDRAGDRPPPRPREPASFTPPALPRPPTRTWALMTTLPPTGPSARKRSAAARASAAVWATAQPGPAGPGRRAATWRRLPGVSRAAGSVRQGGEGRPMVPPVANALAGRSARPRPCWRARSGHPARLATRAVGRGSGSAATSERPGVGAGRGSAGRGRTRTRSRPRLAPPRNMTTSAEGQLAD